jgi:uncharacterized membrane protein YdfJ with MMPL/SSD domain
MNDRRLAKFLWIVIAVILAAAAIGGFLMYRHASDLEQSNQNLTGDNQSLRRQLDQSKTTPTPTPTPEPTPAPTESPSATPKPTPTAKPTSNR